MQLVTAYTVLHLFLLSRAECYPNKGVNLVADSYRLPAGIGGKLTDSRFHKQPQSCIVYLFV